MHFPLLFRQPGRSCNCLPGRAIALGLLWCLASLPFTGQSQNDLRLSAGISNPAPLPVCEIIRQEITIENKSDKVKTGRLDVVLSDGLQISPVIPGDWHLLEEGHLQREIQIPPLQTLTYNLSFRAGARAIENRSNVRIWVTETPGQQVRMTTLQVDPQKITDLSAEAAIAEPQDVSHDLIDPSDCDVYTYYVNGTLNIENERRFENRFSRFVMGPDAGIRVKPGGILHLRNTAFSACEGQWKGIIVEQGGTLKMENTIMEDAGIPVLYENRNSRQAGEMYIYPNPATDKIQIKFSVSAGKNKNGPAQVIFTDPAGRAYSVHTEKTDDADLIRAEVRDLPGGIYHVVLLFSDGSAISGDIVIARN